MPDQKLEFPDHVWKERQVRPSIEVGIDFLPKKYQSNWHQAVQGFADEWVKKHNFQKQATIWMWGCISVNLIGRHPDNPVPSWSDFLIQFGLPSAFWDDLQLHLYHEFTGQSGGTETTQAIRDQGWTAVCHIEQGKAWKPVDAETWAPVSTPPAKRTSRKS